MKVIDSYFEYRIEATEEKGDILVAFLSDMGFESFVYEDGEQCCYIPECDHDTFKTEIEEYLSAEKYKCTKLEQQNWNEAWEADFEPIEIEDKLAVRAPFHPKSACRDEILIVPNMSFGTGHHPTTYMILNGMLKENFAGKRVLDVGCGSAVLGIMAAKGGAKEVVGVDIDLWAASSARGNVELNGYSESVTILDGDVSVISGQKFDYILANIARNVLQGDMASYRAAMNVGGKLFCSGFLEHDGDALRLAAEEHGFKHVSTDCREGWNMMTFVL